MSLDEIDIKVIPSQQLDQPLSKSSFFFFTPSFINRIAIQNSFVCLIKSRNKTLGQIAFVIKNNEAVSLPMSPFGGFDLDPDITKEELVKTISSLINHLKSVSIKKLTVRLYPKCYNIKLYSLQSDCLTTLGFQTIYEDQSQYLIIDRKNPFRSFVHDSQHRHINFGRKHENRFTQLDFDDLASVYQLLKNNREDQGYPMTMEMDQLKFTIQKFPDRYFLFGFFIKGELAAASVCIHVNNDIFYDFYHGHDKKYSKHSPVIALVDGIYSYAQDSGYQLLDFGISTEKGIRNAGLYRFKERIGGKPSVKANFEIVLKN